MQQTAAEPEKRRQNDPLLSRIAELSEELGFDIVEIGGFIETLEAESKQQLEELRGARAAAQSMLHANDRVRERTAEVKAASETGHEIVSQSVEVLKKSGERARTVAEWVQRLAVRMEELEQTLAAVTDNNREIAAIAKQVNILAINAKIEATRAGDAGRGFGTVADAVKELSHKTAQAGNRITGATEELAGFFGKLRSESARVSAEAGEVLKDAGTTDQSLTEIAREVKKTAGAADAITGEVAEVDAAISRFRPAFNGIAEQVRGMVGAVETVHGRVDALIDRSEELVQASVEAGGTADDAVFIAKVQEVAADISAAFEDGIAAGAVSEADLFARHYEPVAGSDPEQVMAPFTTFTDLVLPEIQEPALDFAPSVVFCAAVDTNGYLATHNLKFSHPQGDDPVWNAANCRNRRIFDDRVGLKAGRNTRSFLMQVYRRDMGGGNFVLMKDLSAPIFLRGRHWGGVRLAFKV